MTQHSEIKTVVFDLGQVIIAWDPYLTVEGTVEPDEWKEFVSSGRFTTLAHRADQGEFPKDVIADVAATSARDAELISTYFKNFARSLTGPVPGTSKLVQELRDRGYRTLGLSNWPRGMFHHAPATVPEIGEFEDIIVSGEVGMAKPDPEIFELLLTRHNLEPVQTVFIDDKAENVNAAKSLGIHGIVFTDANTLRTELKSLGVQLGEDPS